MPAPIYFDHHIFIYVPSLNRYSIQDDEWLPLASLQQKRYDMDAAVLDGQIYVVGGWAGRYLASVERYDPVTNSWRFVASLNVARWGHRCCTVNGSLYVLGGHSDSKHLASIEKYDAQIDKWIEVSKNNRQNHLFE